LVKSAAVAWLGFVDDAGHFALDDRRGFLTWVAEKFRGQEVIVTVRQKPKRGTLPQLRYFRGVVIPDIARSQGYTAASYQEVYEGVMFRFAPLPDGPFGAPRRKSLSMGDGGMTLEERTQLIDDVIVWAETELTDCRIRRPHEVDLDDVYDPGWK
jgi:hypothetical protein